MMRFVSFSSLCLLGCAALSTACGSDDDTDAKPFDPNAPISCEGETYCPQSQWLCRPGIENNRCRETQDATVFAADGSVTTETLPKTTNPKIDCFYVYPTVTLQGGPGNATDPTDPEILVPLRAHAVPFSEVCEVYAPFYRQTTFSTFGSPNAEQFQSIAFGDVEQAFDFYLKHYNRGRKFVLLGHSQGAMMLHRLLAKRFDDNPALRSQMLLAMPIGPVGDIQVPEGSAVGGSFKSIPVCTTAGETGCIVAFDSYTPEGLGNLAAPSPGAVCTNPVNFGSAPARLKKSYFPTVKFAGQFNPPNNVDLPTTFSAVPNLFTGQCVRDEIGVGFRVSFTPEAGDKRNNPIDFKAQLFHIIDISFTLRDLIDLVQARVPSK